MHRLAILVAMALVGGACSTADVAPDAPSDPSTDSRPAPSTTLLSPPTTAPGPATGGGPSNPPAFVPTGDLEPTVAADVSMLFEGLGTGLDLEAIASIGSSGDPRLAWLLSDLFRFVGPGTARDSLAEAFGELTGVVVSDSNPWGESTNLLIGWDLAEPPGYRELKGVLFATIDERWAPFFEDADSEIDYRYLNWGGVRPDDRPLGDYEAACRGGCIPALDNPVVTDAAGGAWYPDDGIVFAVAIGNEARAYPKNMMEVHEMVIDTVGGVRFGMPYCTLCGSAQAYDLESVPDGVEPPVLRTSGLLSRSNKVMYDLNTWSAFDTFTGRAVSGPSESGRWLSVNSRWSPPRGVPGKTPTRTRRSWLRTAASDGPTRGTRCEGRDDDGPIFPVGPVDPRLPVQEPVLGVETPTGSFIAFPAADARAAIEAGKEVQVEGVQVVADADGLRAEGEDGSPLVTHEAFWFAWSQFHPDTDLWSDSGL